MDHLLSTLGQRMQSAWSASFLQGHSQPQSQQPGGEWGIEGASSGEGPTGHQKFTCISACPRKQMDSVHTSCSVSGGTEARAGCIIRSWAHPRSSRAELAIQAQRITSPGFSLPLPQSGIPGRSFLTSSGSESLNSQPSPVQLMKDWQDLSVSNSRRNCHSWIGPLPGSTRHGESLPTPSRPTAAAPACPPPSSSPRSLPSACLDRRKWRQGSPQILDQVLWAQKKWRSSFQKTREKLHKIIYHLPVFFFTIINFRVFPLLCKLWEENIVGLQRCSKEV